MNQKMKVNEAYLKHKKIHVCILSETLHNVNFSIWFSYALYYIKIFNKDFPVLFLENRLVELLLG